MVPFDNKKSSVSYLLKGGLLIDPYEKQITKKDILIKNKIIESIKDDISLNDKDVNIINCEKLYICPGLVDMRVNLGEPGFEHKETIKSACMALGEWRNYISDFHA